MSVPAPILVRVASEVAYEWNRLLRRLWRTPSSSSELLVELGEAARLSSSAMPLEGLSTGLGQEGTGWQLARRWNYQRERVPLFSSPRLPIHSETVEVPRSVRFRYSNESSVLLPEARLRYLEYDDPLVQRAAAYGLRPTAELQISRQPGAARGRPEENRRRRDSKVPGFYSRGLALVNRTYGPYSEFAEVQHAFQEHGADFDRLVTALAVNEAVDRLYGARAKFLRERVYSSRLYPFPVGYDMLSRLWR